MSSNNAQATKTDAAAGTPKKRRSKRNVPVGICHVSATFNNTIITFTDLNGDVVAWSSSGSKGFKGSRKSTPFAAQVAAEEAANKAAMMGMRMVSVVVNGPGSGRESAVRAITTAGIRVSLIKDITPIPHNGCRPPKRRRV
jgi:small subunit ribosomal protein S11